MYFFASYNLSELSISTCISFPTKRLDIILVTIKGNEHVMDTYHILLEIDEQ